MKNERLIKNAIVIALIFITLWFGIRPIFTREPLKNPLGRKDLDMDENEYATIVIGSEPEGIASALASARTGLKTLIITEDDNLGSYITSSMISKMNPQRGNIANQKVSLNQGIYHEIFGNFEVGFSAEEYKNQVNKLVEKEKSLEVLYNSELIGADYENGIVKGIQIKSPDGEKDYKARTFIDATIEGKLLELCGTPYFKGSEDIGLKGVYSPLHFNFRVSGVDTQALKKSKKTTNFFDEFQLALLSYEKTGTRTKILSPSFIIMNDNELIITGLQVIGVDVEDENDIASAYDEAEEEAIMLTAFLKTVVTAFKDCSYKSGPESLFIPEYRHFEGRYRLTVSDILENRNFRDKIALSSESVDAGKFVDKNIEYIVGKPKVYSIPLGSIIPSNLDNVLMTGSKASYASLASTSAGCISTRITVGESAGLVAAYSFINDITPADILDFSDKDINEMVRYLKRGGIYLEDFSEYILIPETKEKLIEHWSYPYIKILAEYGLIAGGENNDFKLDYSASQEVLVVLIKNALIKMAPEYYSLNLINTLAPYEEKVELTGEVAASIVLKSLSVEFKEGEALKTLTESNILPQELVSRLKRDAQVTMDVVYGLAIETVNYMKR